MVLRLVWPDNPNIETDPESSQKYVTVNISYPAIKLLKLMSKGYTTFDQTDPVAKANKESIEATFKTLWNLLNP